MKFLILFVAVFIGVFILYFDKLKIKFRRGSLPSIEQQEQLSAAVKEDISGDESYTGTMKLKNVNEQTAAIIMAIVSHESGIPLNQLLFKSISLLENGR